MFSPCLGAKLLSAEYLGSFAWCVLEMEPSESEIRSLKAGLSLKVTVVDL